MQDDQRAKLLEKMQPACTVFRDDVWEDATREDATSQALVSEYLHIISYSDVSGPKKPDSIGSKKKR